MKYSKSLLVTISITALALVGLAVMTMPVMRISTASALTAMLAMTAVVCLTVTRSARQIYRAQQRIEQLVTHNHKRASVWNHHLIEAIGGRTQTASRAPKRERSAAEVQSRQTDAKDLSWKNHPDAERLIRSKIFDAEYYASLVDGTFHRVDDAASHYLSVGASKGISPSPFLDAEMLPAPVKQELSLGRIAPLLDFLRSREALERPLSLLFDPRGGAVSRTAAREHEGGILGAYLEHQLIESSRAHTSAQDSRMATSAAVRNALVAHAREYHASKKLTRPREQPNWDRAAELGWLSELRNFALDTATLPLVSIVMPVKDRMRVVGRAILSVQRQTYANWELLVVDDGSRDGTVERVDEFARSDPRIRLIRNDGVGVSSARNTGLSAASGRYVAFLDSDNEWVDHFLEATLRAMLRDDLRAAYSVVALHGAEGVRYRAYAGGLDHLRILNHIDLNVFVVRMDVIQQNVGFDESLKRWVDHDFALRVAQVADPVLLPFVGCEYDHSGDSADRITLRESEHWQWVVLGRHWVQWRADKERVTGKLSIVIPTYNDSAMTVQTVTSALRDADETGLDVEIIIVDNGSRLEVGQSLITHFGTLDRVRYVRLPRNFNFAIGCNYGASIAHGEFLMLLNNDTVVRRGALARLTSAAVEPRVLGVQPLLVYEDETIQTAGTVFSARNSFPSHLLNGHPPADALGLAGTSFNAITAAALVMRTADFEALEGFDPIFVNGMEDVDFCLRAVRSFPERAWKVVPTAVVTHFESKTPGRGRNVAENRRIFLSRWTGNLPGPEVDVFRSAGFTVAHLSTDGRKDVPGPRPLLVRDLADRRQRWGIHIASIPGYRGDGWGDTHFGESLRRAFEAEGHLGVVHRHGAHETEAVAYDDVALVIRGLDRVRPMPGKVNILWVISHPELVSVDEMREFDLVFAASVPWSHRMTESSGREVRPLLQATDIERFHSDVEPILHDAPIFVGGIHAGRERPVVEAAQRADVPIEVYGPGWEGRLPREIYRGQYIDNSNLAAHYRGAPRVLADHWELMAAEGFIQNRLFDAVACGARVVSDYVEGVDELFFGAVQTFRTPGEFAHLCSEAGGAKYPSDADMLAIAAKVRSEHSFQARARELAVAATLLLHG